MRIWYVSDVHLEFGRLDKPLPQGEVLILDGDITLLNALDPEDDQYWLRERLREWTLAFIEDCRTRFGRIFYLIGNHECYDYNLSRAPKIIKRYLKGVELLENKAVNLGDGVILAGCTLWTDMNKGNDAWIVGRGLNDFSCIYVEDREGKRAHDGSYYSRRFTTADAMARFKKSLRFIAKTAERNPDRTIVVVTHHAPSINGIGREHLRDSRVNAGYYTDLHAFIAEHPNIRFWIHGHTHVQKAYRIAHCQVLSNARGYIGREVSADTFEPDCWFDPVTGERSKGPPTEEELQATLLAEREALRAEVEPLSSDF